LQLSIASPTLWRPQEIAMADQQTFVSKRLTQNEYTNQIEGPAVDAAGNLYVCNFKIDEKPDIGGTIGRIKAGESKSTLFATLPVIKNGSKMVKSRSAGIRFGSDGRMYVADFNNHNVFVIEPGQSTPKIYVTAAFKQPNDLAIARDGTLYASDPNFSAGSGRIWRIARGADGKVRAEIMDGVKPGVTNGLDLSPDDKTLYVGTSNSRQVWAYRIDGLKLADARKVADFGAPPPKFDLDGLRTDVDGRIYVTQNGAGMVIVLKPDGTVEHRVKTVGKAPSNVTFGGPDGKTVFVTQADGGFVESFRSDRPGREPCMQFGGAFCG
jgi:signal peptidase